MSHMKKGVAIPAPRKEISTPAKKKPGRPPKKRRSGRLQQKPAAVSSEVGESETSVIVMSGALPSDNDIDSPRPQKRRNIFVEVPKHYGLPRSDDEEQTVVSPKPTAGSKKRTRPTHTVTDEDSDIQTPAKKPKSALIFQFVLF